MSSERPWRWSRAECLAGRARWAECPLCADRTDAADYCRFCDGVVESAYLASGGLHAWRRYAGKSLASLDWGWLGPQATAAVRACAEGLPHALDRGMGVLLLGGPGSGKTHLAVGLGLVALAHGYGVHATTFGDILLSLRAGFDDARSREAEQMARFCSVDLLILDDLGFEKPSAWAIERLAYLLNRRYADQRATLVTSGFHPAWLDQVWGEAVMSRLYTTCHFLVLTGVGDYRPVEWAHQAAAVPPGSTHWPGTEAEIVVGEG
jgi:hypothetical protein